MSFMEKRWTFCRRRHLIVPSFSARNSDYSEVRLLNYYYFLAESEGKILVSAAGGNRARACPPFFYKGLSYVITSYSWI